MGRFSKILNNMFNNAWFLLTALAPKTVIICPTFKCCLAEVRATGAEAKDSKYVWDIIWYLEIILINGIHIQVYIAIYTMTGMNVRIDTYI